MCKLDVTPLLVDPTRSVVEVGSETEANDLITALEQAGFSTGDFGCALASYPIRIVLRYGGQMKYEGGHRLPNGGKRFDTLVAPAYDVWYFSDLASSPVRLGPLSDLF